MKMQTPKHIQAQAHRHTTSTTTHSIETLQLETIGRSSLGAVHVIADRQNDLHDRERVS